MADEGFAPADLARLRAIAEEGRQRPLLGGRSLVIWGVAIALAALGSGAVAARLLPLPYMAITLIWFGLMAGAAILSGMARRRSPLGSATSLANRVEGAVWQVGGLFLFTLALILTGVAFFAAAAGGGHQAWAILSIMAPVTFGVFAVALAATATAGEVPWLRRFAWASLGFSAASAGMIGNVWQYAFMALGALVVGVWPGLLMTREEGG